MARKDSKGRVLRENEFEIAGKGYGYNYYSGGKRKRITAKTLQKLREKEEGIQKDLAIGLDIARANTTTLNDLWEVWIANKHNIKISTLNVYTNIFEKFIQDDIGMIPLCKLKSSTIKSFYGRLVKQGFSKNYIKNVNNVVKGLVQLALEDDLIRKDITVGAMHNIPEKTKESRSLSSEQVDRLLQFCKEDKLAKKCNDLIVVLAGTGMRIGEVLGLPWSNVDFEQSIIKVNQQVLCVKDHELGKWVYIIGPPKSKAGIREIPMLPEVREVLEKRKMELCTQEASYVFESPRGGFCNFSNITQRMKNIVIRFNKQEELLAQKEQREPVFLPKITPHMFRHAFASRLCEQLTDLKVIQRIMGHENIQMTLNVYAETNKDRVQDLAKNVKFH